MANDVFANIAANGIGGRPELLEEQLPAKHSRVECVLKSTDATPVPKIKKSYTKDELYAELDALRERMKPFMADLAPNLKTYTYRQYINEFKLDGEDITLPHYGGPISYNLQIYESEFTIDKKQDKAYYICFGGADYYSVVYINGVCVGTHEGFFSPFEYEMTSVVKSGINKIKIELYNDCIYGGNDAARIKEEGEKLYAATGLGWDDPALGWHHCPPGMGIYNKVYVEERNTIHITDLYVRPLLDESKAEVWVEINNALYNSTEITINYSVYGQNFKAIVCENQEYIPSTIETVGMGDSLTESQLADKLGKGRPMPARHSKNIYRFAIDIPNPKKWDTVTPYLYQLQASVLVDGKVQDTAKRQFGMRSFTQDVTSHFKPSPLGKVSRSDERGHKLLSERKGMFYLNGNKVRLRGANTMGFEQQDVLRGDFAQLRDDILLAKLCNMNFWRLTQRPVQDEIYDYCDKLGLMTQTDLPLFGCMRRIKVTEGARQAEEMIRMTRPHPCNVVITYINEPFPNAQNEPHRHLNRDELEAFFEICDRVVHISAPDQVIKHVDGDYDPPTEGMPDNHCYPMWYNGHGIDIGKLHKGYWLSVKPGWYYGCGEYGSEGLDPCDVMREMYPSEWTREPFNPSNIVRAQTGNFYRMFFDKQNSMEDWVRESQIHQAFSTQIMTDAFRRNNNMVSNAIHLFIDAWPSGWMKTIMDCRRTPKMAYFAYRDSLEPLMLSLRTDRFTYFNGEKISIECFVCNDTNSSGDYAITYELYRNGKIIASNTAEAKVNDCEAGYSSDAVFTINDVVGRESFTLRAILVDGNGKPITEASQPLEVFEDVTVPQNDNVVIVKPELGESIIAGERVVTKACSMLPVNFVSRNTGHKLVQGFHQKDFAYWYNAKEDMMTPIADRTFLSDGFEPILIGGNTDDDGNWIDALVCAQKEYQGKRYIICTVDLRTENPIAKLFLKN